jgi:hypothetical protein
MQHEAPFLITPILSGALMAIVGLFILVRERAQDRKRKDEEARRHQKSA